MLRDMPLSERLERIGELLARAVYLYVRQQRRQQPGGKEEGMRKARVWLGVMLLSLCVSGLASAAEPKETGPYLVFNTNYIELSEDARVGQASTSTFDAATFELWGSLLHGARLIGIQKEELLSPPLLSARLREEAVSTIFVTTSVFNQLVSEEPSIFDTVEQVLFGGEAANVGLVRDAARRGSPRRLLHVYGPTETTTFASWSPVDSVGDEATSIPIGRAIANTELYVLDENLEPVPIGVFGELYIGGVGLARFYRNRPRLTAEKVLNGPGTVNCRRAVCSSVRWLARIGMGARRPGGGSAARRSRHTRTSRSRRGGR